MKWQYKILIIISFIFTGVTAGIYLDEFTDVIFSTIFSGLFQTGPGTIFNNYECLFLISKIIQKLQQHFEKVNMYGLIIALINSYCIFTFVLIVIRNQIIKKGSLSYWIISIIIVSILFHDFIFIQFTKTAVYCNFLGCFLILESKRNYKQAVFFLICGILLRTETFWFVLVLLLIINVIKHQKEFLQQLYDKKYIWMLLLSSAVLISYLNKQPFNDDDKRYEVFRTYKYAILDFKNKDNVRSVFSEKNEIKYNALHHAFFSDTDSLINTSTFKTLKINAHNRVNFASFLETLKYKHNIINAFYNLSDLAYNNRANYLALIAILIFILIVLFTYKEYNALKRTTFIFLSCFAYIFLITLYIKMEDRILNPAMLIITFYLLHYFPVSKNINKKIAILFIFIFTFTEVFYLSECFYRYRYKVSLQQQSELFIKNWNLENANNILVPDLYSWQLFFPTAIASTSSIKQLKLFSLDNGYLSMMQKHKAYNKKIANANHFIDCVVYLKKNKNDTYFLGTDERIKMMENYINKIYLVNISISKVQNLPVVDMHAASGHVQLYLYKIKE